MGKVFWTMSLAVLIATSGRPPPAIAPNADQVECGAVGEERGARCYLLLLQCACNRGQVRGQFLFADPKLQNDPCFFGPTCCL